MRERWCEKRRKDKCAFAPHPRPSVVKTDTVWGEKKRKQRQALNLDVDTPLLLMPPRVGKLIEERMKCIVHDIEDEFQYLLKLLSEGSKASDFENNEHFFECTKLDYFNYPDMCNMCMVLYLKIDLVEQLIKNNKKMKDKMKDKDIEEDVENEFRYLMKLLLEGSKASDFEDSMFMFDDECGACLKYFNKADFEYMYNMTRMILRWKTCEYEWRVKTEYKFLCELRKKDKVSSERLVNKSGLLESFDKADFPMIDEHNEHAKKRQKLVITSLAKDEKKDYERFF